jgi:hypothetical protein
MIRCCDDRDFELMWTIINDGAQAYKGTIPADRWTEPYMSKEKLQHEIDEGVVFWCYEDAGALEGVMGIQKVQDVTLVRHAYVRTSSQKRGIGGHLLSHLCELAKRADVDRHVGGCGVGESIWRSGIVQYRLRSRSFSWGLTIRKPYF